MKIEPSSTSLWEELMRIIASSPPVSVIHTVGIAPPCITFTAYFT